MNNFKINNSSPVFYREFSNKSQIKQQYIYIETCPLERAAARVCREAGARVTTNTLLADLNLPFVERLDEKADRSHRQRRTVVPGRLICC